MAVFEWINRRSEVFFIFSSSFYYFSTFPYYRCYNYYFLYNISTASLLLIYYSTSLTLSYSSFNLQSAFFSSLLLQLNIPFSLSASLSTCHLLHKEETLQIVIAINLENRTPAQFAHIKLSEELKMKCKFYWQIVVTSREREIERGTWLMASGCYSCPACLRCGYW